MTQHQLQLVNKKGDIVGPNNVSSSNNGSQLWRHTEKYLITRQLIKHEK